MVYYPFVNFNKIMFKGGPNEYRAAKAKFEEEKQSIQTCHRYLFLKRNMSGSFWSGSF